MLFDLMVDDDVKVASLNNAEDDPCKTVFNWPLLFASPYTRPKVEFLWSNASL